jgi:hypothetical protein
MSDRHQRPDGVTDATIEAVGKVSEALEWVERARGDLYEFHQKLGRGDLLMGEAADALEDAGHGELAVRLRDEVVGRNVLDGRWSFQIVEEFDDLYWSAVRRAEQDVRDQLVDGRRHIYESEMKDDRRTGGRRHHERRPDTAHDTATTPLG